MELEELPAAQPQESFGAPCGVLSVRILVWVVVGLLFCRDFA